MTAGSALAPVAQEILVEFAREADEIRAKIIKDLLLAEKGEPHSDGLVKAYKNLARGLHTLKGSAATLGLGEIARAAHQLEDIIAPLQRAQAPCPAAQADQLLKVLDGLVAAAESAAGLTPPAAQPAAEPNAERPAPETPGPVNPAAAVEQGQWHVSWGQIAPIVGDVEVLRQSRLRLLDLRQRLAAALASVAASDPDGRTAAARATLGAVERSLVREAAGTATLVEALEGTLKEICTVPAASILEPLQRSVRDLCRACGKEARLSVVGGELRVDRRILEALRGPLIHLVRNAVDHGIEVPAEREARGKHRTGALVIRIEMQGNLVFLEMSDDGGGLDLDRLRSTAVGKGLMSREQAAALDALAVMRLVFRSGFSTRVDVSDTSGRGVGLDVVESEVRALDGTVEISSVPNQGTRFAITVPAKMGSAPFLRVRCGEHELALPLLSVERILAMRGTLVRGTRADARLEHEGELVKLQDLGAILGLRQPLGFNDGQPLVVVRFEGRRRGLLVDAVVGEGEATLVPLPEELRTMPAYQGTITHAAGHPLLVLRAAWIVGVETTGSAASTATKRALVVDDSLTARAMHRTSLEAGGYSVHAVASGRQALDQLRHTTYDVVICDIGMEDLDGIAFTELVRADAAIQAVPILLVSALEDPHERERGLRAGADGFLSKKDCIGGRLLSEIALVLARDRRAA